MREQTEREERTVVIQARQMTRKLRIQDTEKIEVRMRNSLSEKGKSLKQKKCIEESQECSVFTIQKANNV